MEKLQVFNENKRLIDTHRAGTHLPTTPIMVGPVFRIPALTASLVFWGSCTIYTYASKHVTAENVKTQFRFYDEEKKMEQDSRQIK